MAGFLDAIQAMLSGTAPPPSSDNSPFPNYGAAPSASGINAPVAQVLARIKPYTQPQAQYTGPAATGLTGAISGLSSVDPHASRFGALAQGLAGGLAAQSNANIVNSQLGLRQQQTALENFKTALGIQTQLRQQHALEQVYGTGGGTAGGYSGPGSDALAPPPPSPAAASGAPIPGGGAPAAMPPTPAVAPADPSPAAAPASAALSPPGDSVAAAPRTIQASPRAAGSATLWNQVDPESNPYFLRYRAGVMDQRALIPGLPADMANNFARQAQQDRQSAQSIVGSNKVLLRNGTEVLIPGSMESESTMAAAKAAAEAGAKAQYSIREMQPIPGGPKMYTTDAQIMGGLGSGQPQQGGAPAAATPPSLSAPGAPAPAPSGAQPQSAPPAPSAPPPPAPPPSAPQPAGVVASQPAYMGEAQKNMVDDEHTMAQQFQQRQVSRDRLNTMIGILQTYQPGAFAEQKADLVAKLRGVGINVPDTSTANPAAFQEFIKNASANVLSDVKEQTGGTQPLVSEMDSLKSANANPNLQPAAAAAILGHGLGIIDYKDAHYRDYSNWKKANPYATSTADFETNWAKDNPVSKYTAQSMKGIAYQGQDIPPAASRTVGQTYMTPKGPAVWQAGGWQMSNGR